MPHKLKRRIAVIAIAATLLADPVKAWAQESLKAPLSYSLREYGFVLSTALLGGLVGWYAKVRRGEIAAYSLVTLIGELCTSAFAGLLAFWLCEWVGMSPLFTAAIVGISGHAGTTAIARLEKLAEKMVEQRLGATANPSTPAATPTDQDPQA